LFSGFFSEKDLKPFEPCFKELSSKNKTKLFLIAIEESQTEGSLDTPAKIDLTPAIKKKKYSNIGISDDLDEDDHQVHAPKKSKGEKRKSRGEDSEKSVIYIFILKKIIFRRRRERVETTSPKKSLLNIS
jgi:hypothetical protein